MGEGDHTWNEIEFINPETARKISEFEKQKTLSHLYELDFLEEDSFEDILQIIQHKLSSREQEEEEEENLTVLEELDEDNEEETGTAEEIDQEEEEG